MSKIKDPFPGIGGLMPGVKDGGLTIINLKDEPIKRKPQFKLAIVTAVRLTEEEWVALVQKADQQEVKPSVLIRTAVKEYLKPTSDFSNGCITYGNGKGLQSARRSRGVE